MSADAPRGPAAATPAPADLLPSPSPSPSSPPADIGLSDRIARERLRLVLAQVKRLPVIALASEGYVWWLLSRIGLFWAGLAWAVMLLTVQLWRWVYAARLPPATANPRVALLWLAGMLITLGVLRGLLVPFLFSRPIQGEHYVVSMVYLGLMAGAVGSVAGQVRQFVWWGVLSCGGLALSWFLLGDLGGFWLGMLMLAVVAVLAGHVRDQGKGLTQLVTLAYDNEQLVESLRTARDLAESASLSKTRFFAAASHDLRQPLHALSINATTLEILARRDANPTIRELSQSINRALNQSNGLLDSLLDISNLDAHAVKAQWRAVDMTQLLDDVRDEFAALAAQRGLTLRLDTPDPAHAPLWAWTDPDLLRRILNNLMGNALKFCQEGGVTLGAAPSEDRDGRPALRIFVADTGCGIAEAEQERVFEEFYQIGNRSRDRSNGLGLGLSIVRRTAELLDAGLTLRSTPGEGTRIDLCIERTTPPVSVTAAEATPVEQPEAGMLIDLRVLVVDDEPEILRSLHGLLTQLGCAVRCAEDGGQAIEVLATGFVPQVMLVDHRLRDESGLDVIACVQAVLGPVPAVVVTGDTEPATIKLTRAAGHRVIHKPVQGIQVIRVLREAVRGVVVPAA